MTIVVAGLWLAVMVWALWNHDKVFAPFTGVLTGAFFLFTGLAIVVWGIVRVVRSRGRGLGWAGILAPLLILAVMCISVDPFRDVRMRLRIRDYEPVVARLLSTPPAARENLELADTIVAKGEPLRVVFVQPGSVLNNCIAVVYDPTGEVLKVNGLKRDFSDRDDPEAKRLRTLITGDMIWAKHLEGPWYLCGFT